MYDFEKDITDLRTVIQKFLYNMPDAEKTSYTKYFENIYSNILAGVKVLENRYISFQSRVHGFKDKTQFISRYEKLENIIELIGATEVDLLNLRKDVIDWMLSHSYELKRPFRFNEIINTHSDICIYVTINEKFPDNYTVLKEFLSEPKLDPVTPKI